MLNHATIQGRLVRAPELRTTQGNVAVTTITLAVDRDRTNSDGQREADFIDVVAWRQTAEFICRNFGKGQMAVVSGRLQRREWTDKEGAKRSTVEVLANDIYFAGSRDNTAPAAAPDFSDVDADDPLLPF